MLKSKKIIPAILIPVIIMTVTAVYASNIIPINQSLHELKRYVDGNLNMQSFNAEQIHLKARRDEAERLYNESRKQTALLKNQLDMLNHDLTQREVRERRQKLIEKHMLQLEYYDVTLLIKRLELSQEELELVNKQIIVEQEKLNQGDSTQLAVDNLMSNRRRVENEILDITNRIEIGKKAIETRLNRRQAVHPKPVFTIPVSVIHTDPYTLVELKSSHKGNNLELKRLRAFVVSHDDLISSLKDYVGENDQAYILAISERTVAQLEAETLTQRLDIYIENRYGEYRNSVESYKTHNERRSILNSQLAILEAKYHNGEISELQYLSDRFVVLTGLNEVYAANAKKINAISLMNLIENGIVQGN